MKRALATTTALLLLAVAGCTSGNDVDTTIGSLPTTAATTAPPASTTPATPLAIKVFWKDVRGPSPFQWPRSLCRVEAPGDGQSGSRPDRVELLLDDPDVVGRPVALLQPLHRDAWDVRGDGAVADRPLQPRELILRGAADPGRARPRRLGGLAVVGPLGHCSTVASRPGARPGAAPGASRRGSEVCPPGERPAPVA